MAEAASHVEYLGFKSSESGRVYSLRVRKGNAVQELTVAIRNEAFLAHRVRFQDAPDICFHKLQSELAAAGGPPLASHFEITDSELEAYRAAHAPKPSTRKPKVTPPA